MEFPLSSNALHNNRPQPTQHASNNHLTKVNMCLTYNSMAYIKQEFEESKSRASVADGARSPQVVEDEGVPGNTHEDQQLTDTCHAGLSNLHCQASELLSHLEKLVNEVSAAIDLTKLQFLESMDR